MYIWIINYAFLDPRGEAFYPGVDTLGVQEHKDKEEAIDRMVTDLEKQLVWPFNVFFNIIMISLLHEMFF